MDKEKKIVMIISILVGLGLSIFSFMNIKKYNLNDLSDVIYSGDKSYYFVLGVGILFTLVGLFVIVKEIKDNN